jgi:hypothetical protein
MGSGIVITAVRSSTGRLKLIAWDCSDDEIARLGDSGNDGPEIDMLALAHGAPGQVLTATRSSSTAKLELRLWSVANGGATIDQVGSKVNTQAKVDSLDVLSVDPGELVTAILASGCKRLKLTAWRIDGDQIIVGGDSGVRGRQVDDIGDVALTDIGSGLFATAERERDSGELRVSAWCVENGGHSITCLGDSGNQAGGVDRVSACSPSTGMFITATRSDSSEQVKLISWEIN